MSDVTKCLVILTSKFSLLLDTEISFFEYIKTVKTILFYFYDNISVNNLLNARIFPVLILSDLLV